MRFCFFTRKVTVPHMWQWVEWLAVLLSFSASVWGPPHSVRVVWAPEHTAGHRHAGFRGERVVSDNNTGLWERVGVCLVGDGMHLSRELVWFKVPRLRQERLFGREGGRGSADHGDEENWSAWAIWYMCLWSLPYTLCCMIWDKLHTCGWQGAFPYIEDDVKGARCWFVERIGWTRFRRASGAWYACSLASARGYVGAEKWCRSGQNRPICTAKHSWKVEFVVRDASHMSQVESAHEHYHDLRYIISRGSRDCSTNMLGISPYMRTAKAEGHEISELVFVPHRRRQTCNVFILDLRAQNM